MLERVASYIWGTGLLVLLLGTGLCLSFRLRFLCDLSVLLLLQLNMKKEFINLIIMIVDRQRLCFVVTEIVFNNLAGAQSDLFSITVIRIPLIGKVIIHGDRII